MGKAKEVVAPVLIKAIASALNHLPPCKRTIYRGDAVSTSELEEWRKGKAIITNKFLSCSPAAELCKKFAIANAKEYVQDSGKEYKPVLFLFYSEKAKEISAYSSNPHEQEMLYLPGQKFKAIQVSEEEDMAYIFLEEAE